MNNVNRNMLKAHNNSYLLGPQFSLQAASTAVNERPPKQKETTPIPKSSDSSPYLQQSNMESGNVMPGDRVMFTESPNAPGVPIVYRSPEEQAQNPDRLNLDRRRLAVCPILDGEEQLRLLNYQHNMIQHIEHLNGLKRLIFLDLYDNQIMAISGLSGLRSLRVLMLGKNKIKRIENLDNLHKLDVLDLHGNQIECIENLSHLSELRVLNLAGNKLTQVNQMAGLDSLTELNLRRNNIHMVVGVETLPSLQRLFLSFNDITHFEDISCLGESQTLSEVSLDGNPMANETGYKQTVLRSMQHLRQLDMKRITDEERRVATVLARKEDDKKRENNKLHIMKERRKQAINNAQKDFEKEQAAAMLRTERLMRNTMPDIVANHVANVPNGGANGDGTPDPRSENSTPHSTRSSTSQHRLSRPTSGQSARSTTSTIPSSVPSRDFQQLSSSTPQSCTPTQPPARAVAAAAAAQSSDTLNHLAEVENDTLSLYGNRSIDAFDKNWGHQVAGAITCISFSYIDFNIITKNLHRIRVRFPSVVSLIFNANNLDSLHQLNALASVRRLESITIEKEGNPLTNISFYKSYLLFRLCPLGLKRINGEDVSSSDIVTAERFFNHLAHMTSNKLTPARLFSLLGDAKKRQLLNQEEKKKPVSGGSLGQQPPPPQQPQQSIAAGLEARLTDRNNETIGRAGLIYNQSTAPKPQDVSRREFVHRYAKELHMTAVQTEQKQSLLQRLWPQIFKEMVHKAVTDMYDMPAYSKKALEQLEKT